jgi:glutamate 5-kinase
VPELTPQIMAMAGGSGSMVGTGGMRTKLEAASKAAAAGIATALFNGRSEATVQALEQGRLRGTLIHTGRSRMQARKYWLRHAPAAPGCICVDAGAAKALNGGRASLLPGGITQVSGEFNRGDMVEIITIENNAAGTAPIARGISQYGSAEVRRLAGCHSRDIEARLGYSYGDEVIHRDDLVRLTDVEPLT